VADEIKLSNRDVMISSRSILTLGQLKLPAKAAYAIAKAANKLADISVTVGEVQKKLWEKYGEKDEAGKLKVDPKGSTITIPVEQREGFDKEHEGLMSEMNDLPGLRKITLTEFGDAKVDAATLAQLDWFIKDE
jgi:hypothetical protein